MDGPVVQPKTRLTVRGVLGLIGCLVSAWIHAQTYRGQPLHPSHPLFWIMGIGAILLFFASFPALRRWRDPDAQDRPGLITPDWRALRPYFPTWAIAVAVVTYANAFIMLLLSLTGGLAAGQVRSGEVLPPELVVGTVRVHSALWLVFYLVPFLFFTFVPPLNVPLQSRDRAT